MTSDSRRQGKQLTFARQTRGLSQSQLVKKVKGLVLTDLIKYEKGFEESMPEPILEDIFNVLDFPIEFLDKNIGHVEFLS